MQTTDIISEVSQDPFTAVALPLFVLAIALEAWLARNRHQQIYAGKDFLTSIAMLLLSALVDLMPKLIGKLGGVIVDETTMSMPTADRVGEIFRFAGNAGIAPPLRPKRSTVTSVVIMVSDRFDVIESEEIEMLPRLTKIPPPMTQMKEVRDHTGADKEVSVFVKIDTPGITRTLSVDLKLF